MSASLSPTFLASLAQVYATLRPQALSTAFLSDLAQAHATLSVGLTFGRQVPAAVFPGDSDARLENP